MEWEQILTFKPKNVPIKLQRLFLKNYGWLTAKKAIFILDNVIKFFPNSWLKSFVIHENYERTIKASMFSGNFFLVYGETFRPRSESEEIIKAFTAFTALFFHNHSQPLTVIEGGTGTACQLISFIKNLNVKHALAIEKDDDALMSSCINIAMLAPKTCLLQHDFHEVDFECDVLLYNPPYLQTKHVHSGDAQISLDGGEKGIEHIAKFCYAASKGYKRFKIAIVEVGYIKQIVFIAEALSCGFLILLQYYNGKSISNTHNMLMLKFLLLTKPQTHIAFLVKNLTKPLSFKLFLQIMNVQNAIRRNTSKLNLLDAVLKVYRILFKKTENLPISSINQLFYRVMKRRTPKDKNGVFGVLIIKAKI